MLFVVVEGSAITDCPGDKEIFFNYNMVATDEILIMKNAGTQILMFLTSNE